MEGLRIIELILLIIILIIFLIKEKLMQGIFIWIMKTRAYKYLLLKIIPFIRFSLYYTKLKGNQYYSGYKILRPGHILLTTDKVKLTSFLIPGDFTHAALCVSKDSEEYEIAEMTHQNYTKSYFFDLCKEADRVVILECVDFTDGYIMKMIEKCKSFENTKYDVSFDLGVKELYCSELIYQADFKRLLDCDLSDIVGLNTKYISPDGLYKTKNVKLLWDSEWDLET